MDQIRQLEGELLQRIGAGRNDDGLFAEARQHARFHQRRLTRAGRADKHCDAVLVQSGEKCVRRTFPAEEPIRVLRSECTQAHVRADRAVFFRGCVGLRRPGSRAPLPRARAMRPTSYRPSIAGWGLPLARLADEDLEDGAQTAELRGHVAPAPPVADALGRHPDRSGLFVRSAGTRHRLRDPLQGWVTCLRVEQREALREDATGSQSASTSSGPENVHGPSELRRTHRTGSAEPTLARVSDNLDPTSFTRPGDRHGGSDQLG